MTTMIMLAIIMLRKNSDPLGIVRVRQKLDSMLFLSFTCINGELVNVKWHTSQEGPHGRKQVRVLSTTPT